MYEKKVGKAYLRGCLQSCAVGAVGAVVGVAMLVAVLWLVRGGDVERGSPRLALALLMPTLLITLLLLAGAVVVMLRGRRLDRAFAPWRLEGRQGGPVTRSWHGEIGGRTLDAWFGKGPTLELYLSCHTATRGVIYRGGRLFRAIAGAFESRQPMSPPPLDIDGAVFVADDPGWLRDLLARPEAGAAVRELLAESGRTASVLSFVPNAVRAGRRFLPLSEITSGNVRRWLAALEELASAVDRLGPSSTGQVPTRLEEWARTARDRYLNRILLGFGLVLFLAQAALFLFAWRNVGTP